ncbi:MAG: sortase domain-containing protein [Actinomycetota bacterium]
MSARLEIRRWQLIALIAIIPTTLVGAYAATNTSAWLTQRHLHSLWDSTPRVASEASLATRKFKPGDPIARIVIPSVGMDLVAVAGGSMHGAPSLLHNTAVPGLPGVSAIEGGRFGYGNQFMSLDRLSEGDEVTLDTLVGRFRMTVQSIVDEPASQIDTSEDVEQPVLLLIAPSRSWGGANRIVVRAA